jgi:hypothetical protein
MDFKVTSIFIIVLLILIAQSGKTWDVDFSRRQKNTGAFTAPSDSIKNEGDTFLVKSAHKDKDVGLRQELVILNTQKGFIPSQVRLVKGQHYKIHVVNVNEEKKNVSFIMDGFDQHYATYYGQIKTFNLDPDKEGVFEFECPETTYMGKAVVFGTGKLNTPAPIEINRNVSSVPEQ